MNKISGVYKITNNITGDFYIGSSKNIKVRWYNHKCLSRWSRIPNQRMYQDMAQYGLNNFKFEILEETAEFKDREQYWIDQLRPSYNRQRANGQDIERYKETRRKVSKEWYEAHQEEMSAYQKDWYKSNREEKLTKSKASYNRTCFYEGEILTLSALASRFNKMRIPHAWLEAKKYLIHD